MAQPTPGKRRFQHLNIAAVLFALAMASAAQAAVDLGGGSVAAAGGGKTVPCSQLPELQHMAMRVAILGRCSEKVVDTELTAQSLDGNSSSNGPTEHWIAVWRPGKKAAGSRKATKGVDLSDTACSEGAAERPGRFKASCTHRYQAALSGFAARFSRSQLARFLDAYADQLQSVALDGRVSLHSGSRRAAAGEGSSRRRVNQGLPGAGGSPFDTKMWGLDRLDQVALPLDGQYDHVASGTGVHVYVMDTGIRATHTQFKYQDGRDGSRAYEVFAAPSLPAEYKDQDCEGHGTHVAAVVGGLTYGVARDTQLRAVRVLDCEGNGAVSDVLLALDWLKQNAERPAIISMSLGGNVQLQLDEAVRAVTEAGIHVVVAAGNEDMDACDSSPAREATAVTVAASNEGDQRLWLAKGKGSNYGECVDLFAPGANILSAAGGSDDSQQLRTGTSQAVPFVAGVMAQLLQIDAGTSPVALQHLLASKAAGGQVTEVPGSGVVSLEQTSTPNLIVQTPTDSGVAGIDVTPSTFAINSANAGPFTFTVKLSVAPTSDVQLDLITDAARGSLQPRSLDFNPTNWQRPQKVKLTVFPFYSTSSKPLTVRAKTSSADSRFKANQAVMTLSDSKGDTLNYPKVVMQLPFTEQGSTSGTEQYADDYSVACGAADADPGSAPDVVYYFKPSTDCIVIASLCGSASLPSKFDSRMYLLTDVDSGGTLRATACSNNACGELSSLKVSLKAGVGYAFVVDGVAGASGQYSISISTPDGGSITGQLPPATLQSASATVAAVGPASSDFTPGDTAQSFPATPSSPAAEVEKPDAQADAVPDPALSGTIAAPDQITPAADPSSSSTGGAPPPAAKSNNTVVIIAAVAGGAALALAAVLVAFLLSRRKHRKVQQQQQPQHGGQAESSMKRGSGDDCDSDVVPLPRHLKPIATGRTSAATAPAVTHPAPRHLSAAAGVAASALQLHRQQSGGVNAGGSYTAAVAQLHSYANVAPDYHVVHMPSPRFPGQDTGSPSGARRSLRQRSPTRRPRDGSRATPDGDTATVNVSVPMPHVASEHRLARSSSGYPQQ